MVLRTPWARTSAAFSGWSGRESFSICCKPTWQEATAAVDGLRQIAVSGCRHGGRRACRAPGIKRAICGFVGKRLRQPVEGFDEGGGLSRTGEPRRCIAIAGILGPDKRPVARSDEMQKRSQALQPLAAFVQSLVRIVAHSSKMPERALDFFRCDTPDLGRQGQAWIDTDSSCRELRQFA